VVTDKRTGVKSDKHVDRLGSYNPKLNHIQLDAEKAKEWLSKGVKPSDTMHNILVSQKVIEGKKINVLPRKSPIVDEEAIKKAEEEAAQKAEAEKATEESSSAPEAEEVAAESTEEKAEEAPEVEAEAVEKTEDVEVAIVADEDDPIDHSEIATEYPEAIKKEKSEKAQAQADAEAD